MYKIILDNMSFPSLDCVLELLSTDFKFKFHFQTEINSVQCHVAWQYDHGRFFFPEVHVVYSMVHGYWLILREYLKSSSEKKIEQLKR